MKSLIRHLPIASCVDPYGLGLIFTIAWAVLIFGMLELRQVVRDIGRRWAAYFKSRVQAGIGIPRRPRVVTYFRK